MGAAMTDIRKLMEEAARLDIDEVAAARAWHEVRDIAEASLPAVLEYMEGMHHYGCIYYDDEQPEIGCDCGYTALCKALGVGE